MKIAITAQGTELASEVDPRFGRASYFLVVDTDTGECTPVDNTVNLNSAQGAGVQSGMKVADLGVEALVSGHVGPKAFSVLKTAGVKMYTGATGSVADALEAFKEGKLTLAEDADVDGHWA